MTPEIATTIVLGGIGLAVLMVIATRLLMPAIERDLNQIAERNRRNCCDHSAAEEVRTLLDEELVAWWCPSCEQQLAPDALDPWKKVQPKPRPSAVDWNRPTPESEAKAAEWARLTGQGEVVDIHQWGRADPVRSIVIEERSA